MKVGFVGLGRMGAGMAANLIKAGHDVIVFNRGPGKTDELVAAAPGPPRRWRRPARWRR